MVDEVACPGAELRRFVASVLAAPLAEARILCERRGARVWRVRARSGATAVLKVHGGRAAFQRERKAYLDWAPQLSPRTARLLGVRDAAPTALLLDELPGAPASAGTDHASARVHRQAGAWLARLHRLGFEDFDATTVEAAYARRADAWLRRARGPLDPTESGRVRARLDAWLPRVRGRRRRPCHRDFGPRNWMVEGDALSGVIDFEHARPDLPEADLARLAAFTWMDRPDLRDAFLAGYRAGGGPARTAPADVDGPMLLEAAGTVAWAARHADTALEAAGRAALARILAANP